MIRYGLSPQVERDLEDIWDYIAADSIDAADAWEEKLFEGLDRIWRNPGIGYTRRDISRKPLLFWPVGAYLIVYRLSSGKPQIIAVTHGARNVPAILRNR